MTAFAEFAFDLGFGVVEVMKLKRLFEAIKTPDYWVYCATLAGLVGIVLTIIGVLANSPQLRYLGLILLLPLLIGGLFLIVVVFPMLMYLNRKHRDNN